MKNTLISALLSVTLLGCGGSDGGNIKGTVSDSVQKKMHHS